MKLESIRLLGDVLLVRMFRWDLDASVELGGGVSLDVIADFSDGGDGHRVGMRMGEVVGVGGGVGVGVGWNSSLWRGLGGGGGYRVCVGDVIWFGWNMVRGFIEGRDWYDIEGLGRCVVVPYERVFCCVSGGDWDTAKGLSGDAFFGFVRGLNGFCLGVPYVWGDRFNAMGLKVGDGGVSKRVVRVVVVGGEVEYFHSDVYGVDGDVELVGGGWYLLDKDCDVEVEGDYGRYFRVDGVGVYRFQRRNVLAMVEGDLEGLVSSEYRLPELGGVDGEYWGGVDKGDWDRSNMERLRSQRGSGKRYYF